MLLFKQASACQPPTRRSIACAWNLMDAGGVVLHIRLMPRDVCNETHMVGAAQCRPNGLSSTTWPVVSPEIEPRFPRHGAGNRSSFSSKTSRRKSVPNFRPHVAGIELADLDGGVWMEDLDGRGIWMGDLDGGFGFWIVDWGIWMGDLDFGWGIGGFGWGALVRITSHRLDFA